MKRLAATLVATALLLAGCANGVASDRTNSLTIANAYARATDPMSEMSGTLMTGVFMEISNSSDLDVRLIGGSTDVADRLEIHEVVSGVMRQKEGGLGIASGQTQVLKPGGNHVMLIGLQRQLLAGEEIALTLEFSNGQRLDISVPVKVVNLEQEHYDNSSASPSMNGSSMDMDN